MEREGDFTEREGVFRERDGGFTEMGNLGVLEDTKFTCRSSESRFSEEDETGLWYRSSALRAIALGSDTFSWRRCDQTSMGRGRRNNPWRIKSGL